MAGGRQKKARRKARALEKSGQAQNILLFALGGLASLLGPWGALTGASGGGAPLEAQTFFPG